MLLVEAPDPPAVRLRILALKSDHGRVVMKLPEIDRELSNSVVAEILNRNVPQAQIRQLDAATIAIFFALSSAPASSSSPAGRISPRRLRCPFHRFERRPNPQDSRVCAILLHPVFRVSHKMGRKFAEPLGIGRDMPDDMLRFVERFVFPVIQEQESVHVGQRAARPKLRFLPLLSRLDRPHIRPIKAHDPAGDPIHLLYIAHG